MNYLRQEDLDTSECRARCNDLMECEAYQMTPTDACILHCPSCDQNSADSIGFNFLEFNSNGPITQGNGSTEHQCYIKGFYFSVVYTKVLLS